MKLEPNVAYFVESDRDDTVLLALDAKTKPGAIEWFDTSRDRGFLVSKLEETKDALRFESEGRKYALRKLTLELYQRRVMAKVDGGPTFLDTDAVQRFYRAFPR